MSEQGALAGLRLSRWWAFTAAGLLVAVSLLATLYEENLYRTQKLQEAQVRSEILAASVTAALVFDDPRTAQEYVDALRADPELDAVAVYNMAGMPIAQFTRTAAAPAPARAPTAMASTSASQVTVAQPIRRSGMIVGAVYLRSQLDPLQRRLLRYGGILLLVIMALLVLGISSAAQAALRRANEKLSAQGALLSQTNKRLKVEMAERALAEESLRQSQKMEAIGQLSGGIAHDFNNLLAIMQGNLQLARKRLTQGKTDVQRYIDGAMDAIGRAASVTQRVLAFSRQQPLTPRPVNLNALIEDMRDLLRHSVGENIRIDFRLDAQWTVWCDANQMETVLLNLALNARDAMQEGGTLTIATANRIEKASGEIAAGEYVELQVIDTGSGMTEDVRRRAVDPFFTTKPQGRGTGLGLSQVFGYVNQSNGYLRINSEVGRGAVISILMPRHHAHAAAATA